MVVPTNPLAGVAPTVRAYVIRPNATAPTPTTHITFVRIVVSLVDRSDVEPMATIGRWPRTNNGQCGAFPVVFAHVVECRRSRPAGIAVLQSAPLTSPGLRRR